MQFGELEIHPVSADEFEERVKALASPGAVQDFLDFILPTSSSFLICPGPVVVDGDATFSEAFRDAAILFEGDLDVRGAIDDMEEAAFVVIGGDLRAVTLTMTTDWVVAGSIRLADGLASSARGPRHLVCGGALDAPAIVLEGYTLQIGSVDEATYENLDDRRGRKSYHRGEPRTLHQYARAIEDNRSAINRGSAFFASNEGYFSAAWKACRNPADLVHVFARQADLVSVTGEDVRSSAHRLLCAAHDVLRRVCPVAEGEVPAAESLLVAWLTRGWTEAETNEASSVGGPAPRQRSARAVREFAAGRLVGACRCFDRALKSWHRDEAQEDSRMGVLYIVEAIENVALDDAHRAPCEQILRDLLVCPALVASKPEPK